MRASCRLCDVPNTARATSFHGEVGEEFELIDSDFPFPMVQRVTPRYGHDHQEIALHHLR